ncbi:hypothetical protein GCM10009113_16410 [Marinobacter szutsaonensis]
MPYGTPDRPGTDPGQDRLLSILSDPGSNTPPACGMILFQYYRTELNAEDPWLQLLMCIPAGTVPGGNSVPAWRG